MTNTFHRNDATFSAITPTDLSGTIGSSQITATAWTTYAPNVTASSGTFTSVSGIGRYQQIGKIVVINIQITVTTSGTASGTVFADLPINRVGSLSGFLAGRETINTGFALTATIGTSIVAIQKYDNTMAPSAAGAILFLSGVYESV